MRWGKPREGLERASLGGQGRQELRPVGRGQQGIEPRASLGEDGSGCVPVEQLRELVEDRGLAWGRARRGWARRRWRVRGSLRGGVGVGEVAAEEPAPSHGIVRVEEVAEAVHDAVAASSPDGLPGLRVMVLHELLQNVKVREARPLGTRARVVLDTGRVPCRCGSASAPRGATSASAAVSASHARVEDIVAYVDTPFARAKSGPGACATRIDIDPPKRALDLSRPRNDRQL